MEDPTIKWASSQNDPKNAADLSTYRGDFVLRSDLIGASAQNMGCFVLREVFWRSVRTKRGVFCAEEHQMMCIVGAARREDSP